VVELRHRNCANIDCNRLYMCVVVSWCVSSSSSSSSSYDLLHILHAGPAGGAPRSWPAAAAPTARPPLGCGRSCRATRDTWNGMSTVMDCWRRRPPTPTADAAESLVSMLVVDWLIETNRRQEHSIFVPATYSRNQIERHTFCSAPRAIILNPNIHSRFQIIDHFGNI